MMTRNISLYRTTHCTALVLFVLAAGAAQADDIVVGADCVPRLTRQQQRLYDRASVSTDALRQFIFIRRAILQVDVYETAAWAASVDATRTLCMQKPASASAKVNGVP